MKKDIVAALIIGLTAGALIAILVINLPYIMALLRRTPQQTPVTNVTPTVVQQASSVTLTVTEPQDNAISEKNSIIVKGSTQPKNILIVDTDSNQEIQEASIDGSFAIPISVPVGSTDITITSYNDKNESESKTITVMYQQEKL